MRSTNRPQLEAPPWLESHRMRVIVGLVGLNVAGGLNLNLVPLMTGVFVDELGFSASRIGALLTTQVLVAALVGVILSSRMHMVAPRAAGLVSSAVAVAAALGYGSSTSVPALFVISAAMGGALGVLGVCSAATIAKVERVDRVYAIVTVVVSLLVVGLTAALAQAVGSGGRRALFLVVAACAGSSIALIWVLPEHALTRAAAGRSSVLFRTIVRPIVLVSIFVNVGSTGMWAFTERIGVGLGLSSSRVGQLLAMSTILAMLGGVVAALVARPDRARMWAMVGVIAFGLSNAALAFATNSVFYIADIALQAFFFVFSLPFLTAVAIAIDGTGGLAAAAAAWSTLISAGVPMLAGYMIERLGLVSLGWLGIAATVAAASALYAVDTRRSEQVT